MASKTSLLDQEWTALSFTETETKFSLLLKWIVRAYSQLGERVHGGVGLRCSAFFLAWLDSHKGLVKKTCTKGRVQPCGLLILLIVCPQSNLSKSVLTKARYICLKFLFRVLKRCTRKEVVLCNPNINLLVDLISEYVVRFGCRTRWFFPFALLFRGRFAEY